MAIGQYTQQVTRSAGQQVSRAAGQGSDPSTQRKASIAGSAEPGIVGRATGSRSKQGPGVSSTPERLEGILRGQGSRGRAQHA
jgi:hypothetical protein